jgi:hypothetical protein
MSANRTAPTSAQDRILMLVVRVSRYGGVRLLDPAGLDSFSLDREDADNWLDNPANWRILFAIKLRYLHPDYPFHIKPLGYEFCSIGETHLPSRFVDPAHN